MEYLFSCFQSTGFRASNTEIHVRSSWSCDVCYQEVNNDDVTDILPLPICDTLQDSLDKFNLSYSDDNFCYFCGSVQDGETKKSIVTTGPFLVAQLKRFTSVEGIAAKIDKLCLCSSPDLMIPVAIDSEVTLRKAFRIRGMICHSGTVENGHYTARVYERKSGLWLSL